MALDVAAAEAAQVAAGAQHQRAARLRGSAVVFLGLSGATTIRSPSMTTQEDLKLARQFILRNAAPPSGAGTASIARTDANYTAARELQKEGLITYDTFTRDVSDGGNERLAVNRTEAGEEYLRSVGVTPRVPFT